MPKKINPNQLWLPLFPLARQKDVRRHSVSGPPVRYRDSLRWQRWAEQHLPVMLMSLPPIITNKGDIPARPYQARVHKMIEDNFRSDPVGGGHIKRAFAAAWHGHRGIFRKSGKPYIEHVLAVAEIVASWGLGAQAVAAALIHDLIEDVTINGERVTQGLINRMFNRRISLLVQGVTEFGKESDFQGEEPTEQDIHAKMIQYSMRDQAILPLKLADRLHNMRTLQHMNQESRLAKARETLNVYVPIADRLGMWDVKRELEDLSFKYLEPAKYRSLEAQRQRIVEQSMERIHGIVGDMATAFPDQAQQLGGNRTEFVLERRGIYEMYQRIQLRGLSEADLSASDVWRLNIIVPKGQSCYDALEQVHQLYSQVKGEFAAYIFDPLPNGHRFLHDYVEVPYFGKLLVQIRDSEMYQQYHMGVLAKARYDRSWHKHNPPWLRSMLNMIQVSDHHINGLRAMGAPIAVYTPQGHKRELPFGSTVLDFARQIHQDLLIHAVSAVVNGRRGVELSYVLDHGDRVDIKNESSARPKLEWLEHVRTPEAFNSLRAYFRNRRPSTVYKDASRELDRCLARYHLTTEDIIDSSLLHAYIKNNELGDALQLLNQIGRGDLLARDLVRELSSYYNSQHKQAVAAKAPVVAYYISVKMENVPGKLDQLLSDLRAMNFNVADVFQVDAGENERLMVLAIDIFQVRGREDLVETPTVPMPLLAQIQRMQIKNIGQDNGDFIPLNPVRLQQLEELRSKKKK